MKCEVCGKESNVNYGDANTVMCSDCYGSNEALNKMKEVKHKQKTYINQNNNLSEEPLLILSKIFIITGYIIISILGLLLFLNIIQNNMVGIGISFLNSLFISIIGLFISAFGYLIPYIISIEANTRK